jgi:hypothetical protein
MCWAASRSEAKASGLPPMTWSMAEMRVSTCICRFSAVVSAASTPSVALSMNAANSVR